jgi:site-specific recombinase XerD
MEHIRDFNELMSNAARYLETEFTLSKRTIDEYTRYWRRVRSFMGLNGIRTYNQEVEKQFLVDDLRGRTKFELSESEKRVYNCVKALTEFAEKGGISIKLNVFKPGKPDIILNGPIGDLFVSFLQYKQTECRWSGDTFETHRNYLSMFLKFCNKTNIATIAEIDFAAILLFLSDPQSIRGHRSGGAVSSLRAFFKYAFEQKLLEIDYSISIPSYKSVSQPQLPSTYSEKEIVQLLSSIERSSAIGKRNYAMILMAVRLGFRASDIANLKFEHLKWARYTIEIHQYKTGQELIVPLLPDVGNAIIDYLKYGRRNSDEPYVFLKEKPPYGRKCDGSLVSDTVIAAFAKSGIDTNGRKSGSHALRHSLVSRMLEESTVLPVISEVLGHASTESTRYYLRIDFKSMKQCVLDVPPVAIAFYEQKGGAFYV